ILKETSPSEKTIREINFKLGLNLIVDAGKNQEKGNSVGKTTILKLIDIALGAKDRKYIYFDEETKKSNIVLEEYIKNSKIQVVLEVVNTFIDCTVSHELTVDLFPNGKHYINGETYGLNAYNEKLNGIFFSNNQAKPTFRQLIKMFVRIDQKADNNKFLKFLTSTPDKVYDNIYAFLFNLQEQSLANEILAHKLKISDKDKELKNYMRSSNFNSIDIIAQKITLLEKRIKDLNSQIEILIDSKKFKENENKISEIKIEYAQIKDNLDKLYFQRERIKDIIAQSEIDRNNLVSEEILKTLYTEVSTLAHKLDKEFKDLIKFNNDLVENKLNYFSLQLDKKEQQIKQLEINKNELFFNHKNVMMLIEENKIEEYTILKNELAEYLEELGKNKNIKETYYSLEQSLNSLRESLRNLEESSEASQDNISIFNDFFADFSGKTNSEPFMLYKTDSGFPFGIDYVKRGLSTGTRKSIISAFDLAYQKFTNKINKNVPNFIIHDVIETIDYKALKAIVNIVNNTECQYIVAVLKEKITDKDFIRDEDILVELSETERPFNK
ncbi:TPA: DUF2326 domain-containing protein, partial [Streptococcus agalactiae]|nr:DUF2326 domain-containing protein [Streptococcus agalactiae]